MVQASSGESYIHPVEDDHISDTSSSDISAYMDIDDAIGNGVRAENPRQSKVTS
jgi:hypothetical protein